MIIRASVIQDHTTARPEPLDESLRPAELRKQGERFKWDCLAPQIELAEQAIAAGTDLLVFREDCNGVGNLTLPRMDRPDLLDMMSESIPDGMTTSCLADLARKGSCYVVGCFNEKLDGRIYNTALLLDPHGKAVGKYHKTHLPPVEKLLTTPGNSLPVFETEIGKIGMLVCYDMMTPEVARCLALKGAELLVWPSLGYGWWDEAGTFTVQSRAHDNQVCLVGALPTHSCIVNAYGDLLVSAGLEPLTVIRAEIDPQQEPLQDQLHTNTYLTQTPSLRERHLFERRPELYDALVDPHPERMDAYPNTNMHQLDDDPQAAFEHYRAAWGKLHWQTRSDRLTH